MFDFFLLKRKPFVRSQNAKLRRILFLHVDKITFCITIGNINLYTKRFDIKKMLLLVLRVINIIAWK